MNTILKKKPLKLLLFCFIVLFIPKIKAQNENSLLQDSIIRMDTNDKVVWDMSFSLKTMNVFRGLLPSKAPVFSTLAGVKYGEFVLGFYGGASFNGGYSETDLILMYYKPKYNIRLDWYYNYTQGITNIPTPSGFFDLNPEITRGILDFMVNVQLTKHLDLTSSTFIFGRDRPSLAEDDANDILLRRGEQRYSQYINLQYTWKLKNTKIQAHAGYSFSWNDIGGPSFYGNKPGFNDLGVSFYKTIIDTKNISIPFKASIYVNPLSNDVYLVGSILLLDLIKV
ncbi:hypothetical protein [Maribacter sp. 1_MG-2023]|uniref:hypothetical protein n=1 Tax=Maribacter sp. 1_MG-2023 TaxID=3062677 RepID=UPI0026E2E024|nr:hypothetical protein [Maribacter sp. 1_MG-2023]MDO6470296.1 hypothetical protein [Maribacter sp. 1_MG-2023]